jgi:hypothetical protein
MKIFKLKLIVYALLVIFFVPTLSFGWSERYGSLGYGGYHGHNAFRHQHGFSHPPHYGTGHGGHGNPHRGYVYPHRFGPNPGGWYNPHRFELYWR